MDMDWKDLLLAGAIVGGCLYILYISLWKKPGCCSGCDAHTCPAKGEKK